jgi:hypothetical protein
MKGVTEPGTIADFKVGDQLKLTRRFENKDETYKVEVTAVNHRNNGLVTIYGNDFGTGAFDPKTIGIRTRYTHILSVVKIGWKQPWEPFHPRPSDRGYSNM